MDQPLFLSRHRRQIQQPSLCRLVIRMRPLSHGKYVPAATRNIRTSLRLMSRPNLSCSSEGSIRKTRLCRWNLFEQKCMPYCHVERLQPVHKRELGVTADAVLSLINRWGEARELLTKLLATSNKYLVLITKSPRASKQLLKIITPTLT